MIYGHSIPEEIITFGRLRRLNKFIIGALCLALEGLLFLSMNAHGMTTDDYVASFSEYYQIAPYEGQTFLRGIPSKKSIRDKYAALGSLVPNRYFDGKQWQVKPKEILRTDEALKSLVRYTDVVLLDEHKIPEFYKVSGLSPRLLGYDKEYDLYLATFACHAGINEKSSNITLLKNDNIKKVELSNLFMIAKAIRENPDYVSCPKGEKSAKNQAYFPDGPMFIGFDEKVVTPENSVFHQYNSIRGSATINTKRVNGLGVWGESLSLVDGGRVWGGFFTAEGPNNKRQDSQLVGLEIDVINNSKPGISPNQSKVGLQIVSIGESNSTAAIQVISDHKSLWENGFIVEENSIAPNGAIIASSQKKPVRVGIDFTASKFKDSAIRIGNAQIIRFDGVSNTGPATIGNSPQNFLSLVMGGSGLVVRNNENTKNLIRIDANGIVYFENAVPALISPSGKKFAISVDDRGKLQTSEILK